ncbi:hypothetical protein HD596_010580 [Nonomuraea jabiensis]|uniref:Uncharacterized protein n=1 Tax=Nonomuraea jabiensis TaxID=882448 RepID=A0A7W9LHB6_9ACTN|nr:hypothetical protein [Nonomuraea jabiensis]
MTSAARSWGLAASGSSRRRAAMTSGKSTSCHSAVGGGAIRSARLSRPAPRSRPIASGWRARKRRAISSSFLARCAM